jgi:hypothetical protein
MLQDFLPPCAYSDEGALAMKSLLILAAAAPGLFAGPNGSFSATFANYTFQATCQTPPQASLIPPACAAMSIPLSATGPTSLFSNSLLTFSQILDTTSGPPFLFTGAFTLQNLDQPLDSITGTLAGAGVPTGPPGPPAGFPPFLVSGILTTTGGTGSFTGAVGSTHFVGTAIYQTLSLDTTFATGNGALTLAAVPEPVLWPVALCASLFLTRKRGISSGVQTKVRR